jgi:hypothetical protein
VFDRGEVLNPVDVRWPWIAAEAAARQAGSGTCTSCSSTARKHSKTATCVGTPPSSGWMSPAFDRDRASAAVLGRIQRDVNSGLASGQVVGTPILFIDGVVHRRGYDRPPAGGTGASKVIRSRCAR